MLRWSDWLGQAEEEYQSADWLLQGARFAWCCFTCQQAAEKALKAILDHDGRGQSGHNLLELLIELAPRPVAPELRQACRRLTRYYIPTRYPDAHPSGIPAQQYDRPDAQSALEDARLVLDFAQAQLSPPSSASP
ncbi:HEPN domain-containing protein [bacterium CPR1]|nr:HEPN domain-containing protein [bacterium CPR1]